MTLIFCIHYFLWYGALTSIFGYESVYARYYTNATPMQYGYLNMVLPFMTVLVTPVICSLADRQRSHRSYFTISLVLTTISICLYAMMPLLGESKQGDDHHPPGPLLWGPWIYYCLTSLVCNLAMGINTCLSDSFAVLQAAEQGTSFGRTIVWGTFGWASTALVLSLINQWSVLPRLVPGLVFGAVLLTIDVVVVSWWPNSNSFKLDLIPISAAQTVTGSASSAHRDPSDYLPLNESALINLGTEIGLAKDGCSMRRQMKTRSPVDIVELNRMAAAEVNDRSPASESSIVSETPSSLETVYSDIISRVSTDGSSSVISKPHSSSSSSVAPNVAQKINTKLTPAPNPTIVVREALTARLEKNHDENKKQPVSSSSSSSRAHATSFRMQLLLLGLIMMRRKSLIRYLILFILSGFFMSMHWNYFFLYLERIYHNDFELISALSMVGQSVLGELPFFILSRKVIEHCGRSHTLSISVISIGIRFLLYAYLLPNASMYCIVLADCFQGPNYGLFYVVMTEVGLEFSFCDDETIGRLVAWGELDRNNRSQVDSLRLSLRSTVQSVAFACYEGIGVGLGSLAGGWLVASYGFKWLWLSMAVCSISVGLINLLVEFICPEPDYPGPLTGEQSEFMYASRIGILKRVASPLASQGQVRPEPTIAQSSWGPPLAKTASKPLPLPLPMLPTVARKSAGSRVAP